MRGKRGMARRRGAGHGITPACAGKTYACLYPSQLHRDHPRVCGENANISFDDSMKKGSPPRVRGKHNIAVHDCLRRGITPACAGKTRKSIWTTRRQRDHPRVCGENKGCCARLTQTRGSPPRVRGKLSRTATLRSLPRITPACAGKTSRYDLLIAD